LWVLPRVSFSATPPFQITRWRLLAFYIALTHLFSPSALVSQASVGVSPLCGMFLALGTQHMNEFIELGTHWVVGRFEVDCSHVEERKPTSFHTERITGTRILIE
jgi:hypothetical protein